MRGIENLKKALNQKNITIEMLATLLGIHRNTASSKVNGTTEFTVQEALTIKDSFFPEYELSYLFQKN